MPWIIGIILIVLIFYLIYYFKNRRYYQLMSLIPGPAIRYPFIGNLDLFFKDRKGLIANRLHNTIAEQANNYREQGIFKIDMVKVLFVVIFRADYIEDLLKNSLNIEKPSEYKSIVGDWLGNGLILSDNRLEWKRRRKLLTPVFHLKGFTKFNSVINKKADILVKKLESLADNQIFDLCPHMTRCAFDVICDIVLGIQIDTQLNKNLDLLETVHRMNEIPLTRSIYPWLLFKPIFSRTKLGKQWNKDLKVFHGFTRNVIEKRKQLFLEEGKCLDNNNTKNLIDKQSSLLDILLDIHLTDNSFTIESVCEEVDTFLFAGHDTTAATLSWTLFLIGLYPDIQHKLFDELDSICTKDEDITVDQIRQMSYLEAVLMESMRLYSPVHIIARKITHEMKLGKYTIPRGAVIQIAMTDLLSDQNVFTNPSVFNPDRFLNQNLTKSQSPFSSIPFSAGPRNCIGQKLALNELKIIISKLLINFRIESIDKREDLIIIYGLVVKPMNGLKIKLLPR